MMKPPKCKSCGAEEWRHTCGSGITAKERKRSQPVIAPKSPVVIVPLGVSVGMPALPMNVASVGTGISDAFTRAQKRKEYLKLKARERRARYRAKASKAK